MSHDAAFPGGTTPVLAAGAVLWRRSPHDDGVEIALIHRPKYDDWSHPKGKLKRGEDPVAAALREIREETGMECVLGAPLPTARYLADGRPKEVRYWAAEAVSGTFAVNDEVDRLVWLPRRRRATASRTSATARSSTPCCGPYGRAPPGSARPWPSRPGSATHPDQGFPGPAPQVPGLPHAPRSAVGDSPPRTDRRGSPCVHPLPLVDSLPLPNFGLTGEHHAAPGGCRPPYLCFAVHRRAPGRNTEGEAFP